MQQISVQSWIDKHGGDSKTIKFVEVPVSQMAAAVVSHRVDGAKGDEPFISDAKADIRVIGNAELAIFLQTVKLDPQTAGSMARSRFGAALDTAMMQPVLDAALKYGVLDRPVSADDLVWHKP